MVSLCMQTAYELELDFLEKARRLGCGLRAARDVVFQSGLDIAPQPAPKYRNSNSTPLETDKFPRRFMTPIQPSQPTQPKASREQCKHPQVQIVSRDEDTEYVECKECGEVFESSEFKDMEIEQKKGLEEE
jgi:hypothetical protein